MFMRAQLADALVLSRHALHRHWLKSAAVFTAGACLALIGALAMPRSYYSEARLFVRFGRENQVDPTATGAPMVSLYESRESEINSLIEILRSRAILDRVVDELGPTFILKGDGRHESAAKANRDARATRGTAYSKKHQLAVRRLEKAVTITAPRKSNIITVICKANSPALAQQIVAKLIEVYRDEHVRVHRSPATYAFFEQQAAQSLAAWNKSADELRAMKDRLGVVTIEGGRKKLEDQLADIDGKLLINQTELRTSRAKIASIEGLIATLPETIVTQETDAPNAAFDGMRQTLYQLEAQEHDLAAKMQDEHPRLAAMRQQVRSLRAILAGQPEDKTHATEAINPTRQALESALLAERSQADALTARDRALVASAGRLHKELQSLNAQAVTIDELQQRVALAESNHKEYAQRLEQARINRKLDDERISSLRLVQPASYVAAATGPRRSLVLALGLFLAVVSAMATILGAAWLNPLVTSPSQLGAVVGLPVTGSVPRFASDFAAAD